MTFKYQERHKKLKIRIAELPERQIKTNCWRWIAELQGLCSIGSRLKSRTVYRVNISAKFPAPLPVGASDGSEL